ncbi:hypothetical protein BCR33DRAFT_790350 [Rhizoclosmatium globosum]|uniref:Centromere protein J C-terminal domain-containing protein n=1 Tax=Rhizoclosmatium globosum TaxID=329046 RepID=A0A1Y2BQ36_9FUNG|nr:hypothetical protein BCR33DRAFT_790350 [Rhizoclosmatium globosum]|eukprot:ORY36295.1 hypothetical protein BCR33DRAFT_790350 [Rhizoclosmatium globosum]
MASTLLLARRNSRESWRHRLSCLRESSRNHHQEAVEEVQEEESEYFSRNGVTRDWSLGQDELLALSNNNNNNDNENHLESQQQQQQQQQKQLQQLQQLKPLETRLPRPLQTTASSASASNAILLTEFNSLKLEHESLIETHNSLVAENNNQRAKIDSLNDALKSLKKERDLWEKSARATEMIPSKKEREQLDLLRMKVAQLQQTVKVTEQKAAAASDRYKLRIDELTKQNAELMQEISILEQDRAEALAAVACAAEIPSVVRRTASHPLQQAVHPQKGIASNSITKPLPPLITSKQPLPLQQTQTTQPKTLSKSNNAPITLSKQQQWKEVNPTPSVTAVRHVPPPSTQQQQSPPIASSSSSTAKSKQVSNETDSTSTRKDASTLFLMEGRKALDALQQRLGITDQYTVRRIPNPNNKTPTNLHNNLPNNNPHQHPQTLSYYKNGTLKHKCPDTQTTKIFFNNGDFKETSTSTGRIVYWYASKQILHTTCGDGSETVEFLESGQVERRSVDGSREITFRDGTVKRVFVGGEEESVFPDGTVQRVDADGVRTVFFGGGGGSGGGGGGRSRGDGVGVYGSAGFGGVGRIGSEL